MPVIELPNGQLLDTEGYSAQEVSTVLQQLQEQSPSLFEAQPTTDIAQVDLATASREEINEYARQRRIAQGLSPTATGTDIREENVDYDTGLKDFGFRAKLGSLETSEEKALYLKDRLGEDGFRQDQGGRFIITQQGRDALGLGEGKELAIDEEGLSRYDVADFAGEAGAPLAVGIGTGLLLSGTGFLVAAPLVGVSMGLSKIAEEAYESSQGYQLQSKEDVLRAAAFEGALGIFGEGLGRAVSSIFGRIIKGPAGKEAEAARAQGRELLKANFRPTVEGAAPGLRPVLNRLQAIYEGVFPNAKAADDNLALIMKEMRALGTVDDQAINNLEQVVKNDISSMFSTVDDKVRAAQRALNTEIEADIKAVIDPLRKGEKLSEESVQTLLNAKRVFDKQSDSLFSTASKALGERNAIIPAANIKKTLDRIAETSVEADRFKSTELYGIISRAQQSLINRQSPMYNEQIDIAYRQLLRAGRREEAEEFLLSRTYLTPSDAQKLRQIVRNMGYSDEFKSTVAAGNQSALKTSIDDAFVEGEQKLKLALQYANRAKPKTRTGKDLEGITEDQLSKLLGKSGMQFEGDINAATIDQLREGLNLLQRSRSYYETGMKRFGDVIVEKLYKETSGGNVRISPTNVLDMVVKNNQPEELTRYLRAIRGVPAISGLEIGEATAKQATIPSPTGGRMTIAEAKAYRDQLVDDTSKRALTQRITAAEKRQAQVAAAEGKGAQAQEAARQTLARAWFERELTDPTNYTKKDGVQVIDGIKLARKIDALGDVKKVLFKGELKDINRLTTLMKQTGTEFDPNVLNRFADDNIANSIRGAKEALENRAKFNENAFMQSLSRNDAEGIVSTVFQRGNAERVRRFMNNDLKVAGQTVNISDEARDAVQTAAMTRILRSLGDVDSPAFREAFVSGRLGSNLQSTLNGYGRETIEAMFGKETSNGLFKLADNMVAVSNAPIAGKGGLAAPQIAIGLGIYGMITAPFATLPAAAFYLGMSKALRQPAVLKVLLASRDPGGDAIGQALQVINTTAAQVETQLLTSDEGPSKTSPEIKEIVGQARQNVGNLAGQAMSRAPQITAPQVAPPQAGTTAQVSPILNPDPATQALAQALGRSNP